MGEERSQEMALGRAEGAEGEGAEGAAGSVKKRRKEDSIKGK